MGTLKRNYVFNAAFAFLNILLPLGTAPYISRVFGVTNLGIYVYTYTIVNYFVLFAMLGISNHGNRSVALIRDNLSRRTEMFCEIYSLQLITSSVVLLFYLGTCVLFLKSFIGIALLQSLYIIGAALDITWFFFGLEKFKLVTSINCIIKLFVFVLIFVVIRDSNDLPLYVILQSASIVLSHLVLVYYLKREIIASEIIIPGFDKIKRHLKPCLILFLPVVAVSIYSYMSKILIGALGGVEQLSYYENAYKIVSAPIMLITALGTVMLPHITYCISNNRYAEINHYIKEAYRYVSLLSFPIMMGLLSLSTPLAVIVFGKNFSQSGPIIFVLSMTIVFISYANIIRTMYLIPMHKDGIFVKSVFCGAIINILLNPLFIIKWGGLGAAVVTLLSEVSVWAYQTYYVKKEVPFFSYIKENSIFFVAATIMSVVVWGTTGVFSQTVVFLCIEACIGGIVYAIMIFLLQRDLFFELLSKMKKI